jgi:hypothetical protein
MVLSADRNGKFRALASHDLPAGTQVVAGFTDASGNEQAVAAFVPGLAVLEHSSVVHGWTVGSAPRLVVQRSGRVLADVAVHPGADGTFTLSLHRSGRSIKVRAGDVLIIGSKFHHHAVTVPRLALRQSAAGALRVEGPAGSTTTLSLSIAGGVTENRMVRVAPSGSKSVAIPASPSRGVVRVTVQLTTAQGDLILAERSFRPESRQ